MLNRPVDVIAVCNADGTIRPLRFRFEDESNQLLRADIEEVVSIREVQFVGVESVIFLCRATVGGQPWMFELKYAIRTHNWCIHRRFY